jgi:imidazolonepropionase-like amidohydrolase
MLRLVADRLIDVARGDTRAPGVVCADGDRIVAVDGPSGHDALDEGEAPGDLTLSLPGCTLLPGLIDFHSHLGLDTKFGDLSAQVRLPPHAYLAAGAARVQEDLRAGVTTVRLCGDRYGADLRLREEISAGHVVGPRLLAAGLAVRSPCCRGGAVAAVLTDDPEEISRTTEGNLRRGADLVKLFVSDGVGDPSRDPTTCYYGEAHVAAAARPAHAAGRPVAAHLLGGQGVAAALGGGDRRDRARMVSHRFRP